MKRIKLFEEFINEAFNFKKIVFNSHTNHNPNVDIVEGHIDNDSFIVYGIYVNNSSNREKGTEFMEYYSGSNYKVGSTKRSNSKHFEADKIPSKYKGMWNDLKDIYEKDFKE